MGRSLRTSPLPTLTWAQRHSRMWDSTIWLLPVLWIALAALLGWRAPALGAAFMGASVAPLSSASAIATLTAIASGMIALTAIVFSLVFVALQFGSASYSPRLLRVLASNNLLSTALGVFTGTFIYALVAVRAVDLAGTSGINAVAVWVAWGWLLASVVTLVLLIPKVQSLSLVRVLPLIGHLSEHAISWLYPSRFDEQKESEPPPELHARQVIRHEGAPGYLTAIDVRRLVGLAEAADGLVSLPHAVGDFVLRGAPVALVSGAELPASKVRRCLVIEPYRAVRFDPAYGIRLLVDIAIRALSPAVNDPTTAAMVLDQLESLLCRLAWLDLDVGQARDVEGVTRLVFPTPTWEDLLRLSVLEIQQYGSDSVTVERRLGALLHSLEKAVPEPRRPAVRRLLDHREKLVRQSFASLDTVREAEADDRQGLGLDEH
ncbi:MAG: DUF2254 domain-containing protein [Myxococcales bacterium]|jgi:uncharacterized membrane protein